MLMPMYHEVLSSIEGYTSYQLYCTQWYGLQCLWKRHNIHARAAGMLAAEGHPRYCALTTSMALCMASQLE
jgi:hypothetical protein